MNTTIISGNLTREPESRAVGDQSVINFSIANNDESKKQPDGSYVKIPSYFDIEFWTKNPAHWLKQLVKGAALIVQGRLKQDTWEQEGNKRSRVKIIVDGYPIVAAGKGQSEQAPAPSKSLVPPVVGPESFDDDSNIPDAAWEAVITNLALRLAPSYGKQVNIETKVAARHSLNTILSRAALPAEMKLPSMPTGAGNKSIDSPFTQEPTSDLIAGPDSTLDFN